MVCAVKRKSATVPAPTAQTAQSFLPLIAVITHDPDALLSINYSWADPPPRRADLAVR